MSVIGSIANISRGSLHDGGGIRTVVYFKGCPLRCQWCHNPEALAYVPTVVYSPSKCIRCGDCAAVGCGAILIDDGELMIDREKCRHCGRCADACPTGAISLCGEMMSTDDLYAKIKRDVHYFRESGGGVTLSGGECLMQADFAAELLKKCREDGIHTAIETSLSVPFDNIGKVLPYVDLIFADMKHHDAKKHAEYTGKPNDAIIENLRRLSKLHDNIIIRIPLIPGVNDSEADMDGFGEIIRTLGGGIRGVELLKYNYLAKSKYEAVGLEYTAFGMEAQSDEAISALKLRLEAATDGKCSVW